MEATDLSPITEDHKKEMRDKIMQLEAAMFQHPEKMIHIEPVHYFANGLYAREITIPKDVTLTGLIHKTEHLCVLAKGEIAVWTDEGMKRIKAPYVVHSLPGIKRAIHALEESVWINFHHNPTNEKDLEKIEAIYTVKTFEELEQFEKLKIEGGK